MELFTESNGWEQMRADVRFTVTAGRASKVHGPLTAPLGALLGRWGELEAERRGVEDRVEDAHTEVAWAGEALGEAVERAAMRLLLMCNNDRAHPVFVAFFPEAPHAVARLGPEAKVERVSRWAVVRQGVKVDVEVGEALDAVDAAAAHVGAALGVRKAALDARALVSLRQKAWREEANVARRAVEVALDQHAVTHRLPKDYGAKFFPKTPTKRKPKAADAKRPDAAKTDAKKTDVLAAKTVPPARPSVAPPN